jgi:DNA-binding NtrC family response regulator
MGSPSDERRGQGIEPPAELARLHRHSLTTLLVLGGQANDRRAVAFSFHRASQLHGGPFVALDCRKDEARLRSALQAIFAKSAPDPGPDPVRAAWGGTLFLDEVEALSDDTQRLLLRFAQHTLGGSVAAEAGWPVRLTAGASESPGAASSWSFLPELHDEIDKIRVDLDRVHAGAA